MTLPPVAMMRAFSLGNSGLWSTVRSRECVAVVHSGPALITAVTMAVAAATADAFCPPALELASRTAMGFPVVVDALLADARAAAATGTMGVDADAMSARESPTLIVCAWPSRRSVTTAVDPDSMQFTPLCATSAASSVRSTSVMTAIKGGPAAPALRADRKRESVKSARGNRSLNHVDTSLPFTPWPSKTPTRRDSVACVGEEYKGWKV
jgi:hypothetical protein